MSETTSDDRDDAAPVSARPQDGAVVHARPFGFVGLSGLGLASAARLASRFPLLGCDPDPARLSLLVDRAGPDRDVHTTPVVAELTQRCALIAVWQQTASEASRAMAELAATARSGTMLLDFGTSHPATTRRLAAELSDRSVHLLDAALLGTDQQAENGTLIILAGGAEAVLTEAQPYIACLGTVMRTGAIGTGHVLAALLGAMSVAGSDALEEARSVAERSGIDTALLQELMDAGAGRPTADSLAITASLGAELGVPMPLIAAAAGTWRTRRGDMPIS